ncbi:MAG: T9SS type A sorting domain-containing protein [Bacteroidales bacterium]|nr:T9SS type A sorting domain-containing protein [Bacteroidales bacterium]
MRKFTLLFVMMLTFSLSSMAQTIENFESIKMNIFAAGSNGSLTVVPNPDPSGINTSGNVVKMVRGKDGDPWAGWYSDLQTAVDVTANKYVHLKVWKPRISPVVFKYEGALNSGDVYSMQPQTLVNQWEELVFNMGDTVSGDYLKVVLIPDFETPLTLTEDITLYFDDIYANNDPTIGSAPVQIIDNYETIPLNYLLGGAEDLSSMMILPNPDPSGINISDYVIKFNRDKDGVPWGGFWSSLPAEIDVTTNKFVHVKVWKPRISPIKFKIENGPTNHEIFSKNEQSKVNEWEDIVFDFSEFTGTWPIIAFLPDFNDPVGLTEDITIYFDDIILNNDPDPVSDSPELTLNVDMSDLTIPEGTPVYLSGALGGIYGNWAEPGTNPNNEMFDTDSDKIYTITIQIPVGLVNFKFFLGTGWGGGDPVQEPGLDPGNRTFEFSETISLTYKWGVQGILSVPENPLLGKVKMFPNPVSNELVIKTTADVSRVTITSMLGQVVGSYEFNSTGNQTINTSSFNSGMYFVTFTGKDGSKLTQKLMKN